MTTGDGTEARPITGAGSPASREINWYETFTYATRLAGQHDVALDRMLPVPGSIQWCGLPDDDARKLLSLVLGGVREALTNDTRQDALRQAGEDIWAGTNWSQQSRALQRRREIDKHREDGAA